MSAPTSMSAPTAMFAPAPMFPPTPMFPPGLMSAQALMSASTSLAAPTAMLAPAPMSAEALKSAPAPVSATKQPWTPMSGWAQPLLPPTQPWAQPFPTPTQSWTSGLACQPTWPAQGTETAFPLPNQPVHALKPWQMQPQINQAHLGQDSWMSCPSLQSAAPVQSLFWTTEPFMPVPNQWVPNQSMMQASAMPPQRMPIQPALQINGQVFQQQPHVAPETWTSFLPDVPLQPGQSLQPGVPLPPGLPLQLAPLLQPGQLPPGPPLQQHWLPHLSPPRHRAVARLRESSRAKAHKIVKPGDKRRGKQHVVQGPPAKTIVNKPGQTIVNALDKAIIGQPATTLVNIPAVTLINKKLRGLNSARPTRHPLAQVTSAYPMINRESGDWDENSETTRVKLHGELMTAIHGPMPAVFKPVPAVSEPTPVASEPMLAASEPMSAASAPMPAELEFPFADSAVPESFGASELSEKLPTPENFSTEQLFNNEKALADYLDKLPATLEEGAWPGLAALPEISQTPVQISKEERMTLDSMSEFFDFDAYPGKA